MLCACEVFLMFRKEDEDKKKIYMSEGKCFSLWVSVNKKKITKWKKKKINQFSFKQQKIYIKKSVSP